MESSQRAVSDTDTLYRLEAMPAWVQKNTTPGSPSSIDQSAVKAAADSEDPLHYLYLSYQDRISADQIERFSQRIFRVNDESQIPDSSQFLYQVSPDNGRVDFHHCNIIRGNKVIDCLNTDRIRVLQRDTGLEQQMISDVHTIELIIDDLRVDDIIDIASTDFELAGSHPLNGKFHLSRSWLTWGVGVDEYVCRTVNDGNKPVIVQHLDTVAEINESIKVHPGESNERRYQNLTPERNANYTPHWFWPSCLVATTDQSWQEISVYLHEYYCREEVFATKLDNDIPEELEHIDWQSANADSLIAIVRFVQDKVRYRAESNGIYTHTPKDPIETLKRRTGDCKDKSALLMCLLAKIGIESDLVLVNTYLKEAIRDVNPSPFWFDHMIVGFNFEGKSYFVDSTLQKQGGDLQSLAPLGYGLALPLTEDGSALVPVGELKAALKYEDLRVIDMRHDTLQSCTIEITRTYYQERANGMRYHIASTNKKALHEDFRDSAASQYELSLEAIEPITILSDDVDSNIFVTREQYRITDNVDDIESRSIQFSTRLHGAFDMPSDEGFPVATSELDEIRSTLRVMYSNSPPRINDECSEKNEFFDYFDSLVSDDSTIECTTRFRPCVRVIPADKIKACQEAVDRIEQRVRTSVPITLDLETPTSLKDHLWYLLPLGYVMLNMASLSKGYSLEINPFVNLIAGIAVGLFVTASLKPSLFSSLRKTQQ